MELGHELKQVQVLSPRMIQAMEILQMGTQELQEYIDEMLLENPVIEIDHQADETRAEQLKRKFDWLASTDMQNRHYTRQDSEADCDPLSFVGVAGEAATLYFFLRSQVQMERLPCQLARTLDCMMQSLNANGWLDEAEEDLIAHLQIDGATYERALRILHSLSPAGVGARDLRECLMLQLQRNGETGLAMTIVRDHLVEMSRDRYHSIAQATGASRTQIQQACDLIRALNPRPGAEFAEKEYLSYIVPDVAVVKNGDRFEVVSLSTSSPTLKYSNYYSQLWKETSDEQVKDYLNGKLRQAQWVIQSIDQRKTTLLRCVEYIVACQEEFFRYGKGRLRPLLLMDVAARMEVHESTVSRTVRNKYLQCSFGVFPLSYFFSRSCSSKGGSELSPDRVKTIMRKLIDDEDKTKPLSDTKLQGLLKQRGIDISRRTIAKYRDEMELPSSVGRKQFA